MIGQWLDPIVNPVEPVAEIVSESPHNYILNFSLMGFRKKDEYINCREIPVMDTEQKNIQKVEIRQGFFYEIKQKFQIFLTNGLSHN